VALQVAESSALEKSSGSIIIYGFRKFFGGSCDSGFRRISLRVFVCLTSWGFPVGVFLRCPTYVLWILVVSQTVLCGFWVRFCGFRESLEEGG